MTDRLEDLIQRWREQSATDDEPWAAQALSQCADELSAVLRAEAPRPLEDQNPDTRGGTPDAVGRQDLPHRASGDSSTLTRNPKKMADALQTYAEWCGGVHDDLCPEDDTCECSVKWVNYIVTAAINYLRAALTAVSPPKDQA